MRTSKLLLHRQPFCFALGTVQTDTVCNNTCASSGSPAEGAVEMDPTAGSCSVLDSTQVLLGAVMKTYPVQYLSRRCTFSAVKGGRTGIRGNFQTSPKSEMILKISLSSFEIVYLASNTGSPSSAWFCSGNWWHQ